MLKNCFINYFEDAFHNTSNDMNQIDFSDYIGNLYQLNEQTQEKYMTVLSGGSITATYPYAYECTGIPYYCMIYTESGAGSIHIGDKIYTLGKHTILLLRCDQYYHIDLTMAPWTYSVFFLKGELLASYFDFFTENECFLHKLGNYSPIPQHMKSLAMNAGYESVFYKLSDAKILTEIFTEVFDEIRPKEEHLHIPAYIQEMHQLLNQSYAESFLLDDFEAHFNISKYRLCREFTHYYGEAPLTYLNHKRINIAKELLLSSDMKIYEVGIAVGIENTNHFINLFKKNTGVTPLYYKNHYSK